MRDGAGRTAVDLPGLIDAALCKIGFFTKTFALPGLKIAVFSLLAAPTRAFSVSFNIGKLGVLGPFNELIAFREPIAIAVIDDKLESALLSVLGVPTAPGLLTSC